MRCDNMQYKKSTNNLYVRKPRKMNYWIYAYARANNIIYLIEG